MRFLEPLRVPKNLAFPTKASKPLQTKDFSLDSKIHPKLGFEQCF